MDAPSYTKPTHGYGTLFSLPDQPAQEPETEEENWAGRNFTVLNNQSAK